MKFIWISILILGEPERVARDNMAFERSSHIDTAMRNEAGANRVALNGEVMRGLFLLTNYTWQADGRYRLFAVVFRGYLDICCQGVTYLKDKRELMKAMAIAYEVYMRNSSKLNGSEFQR